MLISINPIWLSLNEKWLFHSNQISILSHYESCRKSAGSKIAIGGYIAPFILPLIINSLRITLRPFFFCQIVALGSRDRWKNRRNPHFSFGKSFNEKKISERTDITATTHLGLPNLCINSSESLANRYEIDK